MTAAASASVLTTVPDYAATCRRFAAWWDCGVADRPPVCIQLDRARTRHSPPAPEKAYTSLRERWFDLERALEAHARWIDEEAVFAGDSLPVFFPNLGPEILATCYGAELEFTERSSWSKPVFRSCRDIVGVEPDLSGPYWSWIHRATALSLEMGRGRWITATTDLHSNGDLLAALREPQHLLEEMADDPDAVRAAMEWVTPHYDRFWNDCGPAILGAGQPSLSWIHCPWQGRACVIQCDLICMMGPRMFRDLVLPALKHEMAFHDRTIFHLDGPGALRHLDDLLACADLDGIQWVAGVGNGPARKWAATYRKIQQAGKCQQILCDDLDDARALMREIGPEGAWFCVGGRYPQPVVDAFLDEVRCWADGQRRR